MLYSVRAVPDLNGKRGVEGADAARRGVDPRQHGATGTPGRKNLRNPNRRRDRRQAPHPRPGRRVAPEERQPEQANVADTTLARRSEDRGRGQVARTDLHVDESRRSRQCGGNLMAGRQRPMYDAPHVYAGRTARQLSTLLRVLREGNRVERDDCLAARDAKRQHDPKGAAQPHHQDPAHRTRGPAPVGVVPKERTLAHGGRAAAETQTESGRAAGRDE